MVKKFSSNLSMEGWSAWKFIRGRKKLVITLIGLLSVKLAFDAQLTGLLAGGAVFEGVWSLIEYYFKKIQLK